MLWNFTVDAPSPYITYQGSQWAPIQPSSDNFFSSYSNGTAVATSELGDLINFTFNGTAVWFVHLSFEPFFDRAPSLLASHLTSEAPVLISLSTDSVNRTL